MFEITGLTKQYGTQTVLNGIDLAIPDGCVFGLLGPNGAGKTTLLSILIGLVAKSTGKVMVNGLDLDHNIDQIKASIGFVPQDLAFYPMLTARENLEFFAGALGLSPQQQKSQIEFCIKTAGLEDYIDKRAQNYSGGLKRRLNLAIGLLNKPQVLCLDEPTVGIDPHSRNFILQTITDLNRQGITVIYTTHYMEEVEQICDRVAIIDHGEILVYGNTDELLKGGNVAELKIQLNKPISKDLAGQLLQRYKKATVNDRQFIVTTAEPTPIINDLIATLQDHNLQIERLHYGFKNLEELFLSLTSKRLRDTVEE